jgi:hypothetical protein
MLFAEEPRHFNVQHPADSKRLIPALLPRDERGHQFVVYADCCSGVPGSTNERNFAAVNAVVANIHPQPDFIIFPGDHIMGLTQDYASLRQQWNYWLHTEMGWLKNRSVEIFHTTSNHNTYDVESEQVWREVFPEIPRNGPTGQEGLSYVVRRNNFLLVCVNTAFSGLGGNGHVDHEWLDRVLRDNDDATYKFVAGHHPARPVNGYERYPFWRIFPNEGEAFWDVLVKHRVQAYLCSHIIAFDVQARDGVLQICTGGAGTNYGPGGFMPGRTEYLHAAQFAVDPRGVCYQVLDTNGAMREWLEWPLSLPPADEWEQVKPEDAATKFGCAWNDSSHTPADDWLCVWRFSGVLHGITTDKNSQTLLCGWDDLEGPATIWIGFEGCPPVLTIKLLTESGMGTQIWTGPAVTQGDDFDFHLALHTGMGPGGVLYRPDDTSPWSSLQSSASMGAENLVWPRKWDVGHSQSGTSDRPFLGDKLRIAWTKRHLPTPTLIGH